MSVNHDVGLTCIQWRTSNRQGRPPVGVARLRVISACCSKRTGKYRKKYEQHKVKKFIIKLAVMAISHSHRTAEITFTKTLGKTCLLTSQIWALWRYCWLALCGWLVVEATRCVNYCTFRLLDAAADDNEKKKSGGGKRTRKNENSERQSTTVQVQSSQTLLLPTLHSAHL